MSRTGEFYVSAVRKAMTFEGAVVREQGVTFGIVVVKRSAIDTPSRREQVAGAFAREVFGPIPIILMAQDSRGTPTYWGRKDIVRFLSRVSVASIPWKKYTVAA